MSFLAPKTESALLSPSTPARVSTYKEAEAVPYAVGFFRVAVKWITDRFNDHWSNGSQTGQAYCSIAGVITHGPIDHVRIILKAGDSEWGFYVDRPTDPSHPHYYYYPFSYGGPDKALGPTCIGRIYWGREDQPVDTWLCSKTGQSHPPYRGMAYVIFERLHCGQITAGTQAKPALPNVEFTGYRMASDALPANLRVPSTLSGAMFRGVNVVSALADILTNQRAGLALDDRTLDFDDWAVKAQALENGTKPAGGASGYSIYISPVLGGDTDAQQIVADALSYIDGWIYSQNGKLRIDWYPNDGSVLADPHEISHHDLVEPPIVRTASLTESPTTIVVSCLDSGPGDDLDVIEAVETAAVPFVRELRGQTSVKKLERPWITNRDIAAGYAARYARACTVPEMEGSCEVRLDRAFKPDGELVAPGDIVRLNWEPSALLVIARVTETKEEGAVLHVKWMRERGMTSLPFIPAVDPREDYNPPAPAVLSAAEWVVLDSPDGFGSIPSAIVLASRPSTELLGCRVWMDVDGDWASGAVLLATQTFAATASTNAAVDAVVGYIDIAGVGDDLSPALGSGLTDAAQLDDTLLLVVEGEWMSIGSVEVVSAGVYRLGILRGRMQSAAQAHGTSTRAWVVARADLRLIEHATFQAGETRYFKVQTYNATEESDMSAAQTVSFRERPLGSSDVLEGYLTVPAHALPASSGGVVASYSGASGHFVVTCNGVDVSADCLFSVANNDSAVVVIGSSGDYSVSAVTNTVTNIVLRAVYRGRTLDRVFSLTKANAGTNGTNGQRGTVQISASIGSGTAWSTSAANAAIAAAGLTVMTNDVVTLYNLTGTYTGTRKWNGSSWVAVGTVIDGSLIVKDSIDATSLKAVTAWAKQFTIGTDGYLNCGQTAFNTGIGWWMDYNAGNPRMSLGVPGSKGFTWNGSAFSIYGDSLTIGKFSFNSATADHGAAGSMRVNPTQFAVSDFYPVDIQNWYSGSGFTFDVGHIVLEGLTDNGSGASPYYSYRADYGANGIILYAGSGSTPAAAYSALAAGPQIYWSASYLRFRFGAATSLQVNSGSVQVNDRLNLWSSGNPVIDFQNSLRWTVGDGSYQVAKLDGGNFQLNAPLRVQSNTATSDCSATIACHKFAGGFTAPGTAQEYTFTIDLSGKGFTGAPNWGIVQALSPELYDMSYRDDSSSSTSAVIRVRRRDGAFASGETVWYKGVVEMIG